MLDMWVNKLNCVFFLHQCKGQESSSSQKFPKPKTQEYVESQGTIVFFYLLMWVAFKILQQTNSGFKNINY